MRGEIEAHPVCLRYSTQTYHDLDDWRPSSITSQWRLFFYITGDPWMSIFILWQSFWYILRQKFDLLVAPSSVLLRLLTFFVPDIKCNSPNKNKKQKDQLVKWQWENGLLLASLAVLKEYILISWNGSNEENQFHCIVHIIIILYVTE